MKNYQCDIFKIGRTTNSISLSTVSATSKRNLQNEFDDSNYQYETSIIEPSSDENCGIESTSLCLKNADIELLKNEIQYIKHTSLSDVFVDSFYLFNNKSISFQIRTIDASKPGKLSESKLESNSLTFKFVLVDNSFDENSTCIVYKSNNYSDFDLCETFYTSSSSEITCLCPSSGEVTVLHAKDITELSVSKQYHLEDYSIFNHFTISIVGTFLGIILVFSCVLLISDLRDDYHSLSYNELTDFGKLKSSFSDMLTLNNITPNFLVFSY